MYYSKLDLLRRHFWNGSKAGSVIRMKKLLCLLCLNAGNVHCSIRQFELQMACLSVTATIHYIYLYRQYVTLVTPSSRFGTDDHTVCMILRLQEIGEEKQGLDMECQDTLIAAEVITCVHYSDQRVMQLELWAWGTWSRSIPRWTACKGSTIVKQSWGYGFATLRNDLNPWLIPATELPPLEGILPHLQHTVCLKKVAPWYWLSKAVENSCCSGTAHNLHHWLVKV